MNDEPRVRTSNALVLVFMLKSNDDCCHCCRCRCSKTRYCQFRLRRLIATRKSARCDRQQCTKTDKNVTNPSEWFMLNNNFHKTYIFTMNEALRRAAQSHCWLTTSNVLIYLLHSFSISLFISFAFFHALSASFVVPNSNRDAHM